MLDILIPVFNANDKLRITLDSIFSQSSMGMLNVIVVDNCSNDWDYSVEVDFPEATFYHNQLNLGRLGNWDECLKHVKGNFYLFLMAGDKFLGVPSLLLKSLKKDCAYVFDMKVAQGGGVRELNKWRNHVDRVYASRFFLRTYLLSAQVPWGPLQTWIFPSSTISQFSRTSQSHADILYILDAIRNVKTVKFVKFPIVQWTMSATRFHATIDILTSKKTDFIITKHFLHEEGISFSELVLAIRFLFWSGVIWLRNPTFNPLKFAGFLFFRKAEQRRLHQEILEADCQTLKSTDA